MNHRLSVVLCVLITLAWAANFVAALVVPGWDTNPGINGMFLAALGGVFALDRGAEPVTRWVAERADVLIRYLTRDDVAWLRAHGWHPPAYTSETASATTGEAESGVNDARHPGGVVPR